VAQDSDRGILIAIEGIDGAGKTTQVKKLVAALNRSGQSVVSSKEPTNGQWGSILRKSAQSGRLSLDEELQTFIKDRAEHVDTLIRPHLQAGDVVVLDRYFYSTIAYQGARGADVEAVSKEMHDRFPEPDLTFIIDLDPVIGIRRIAHDRGEEPNHFEDRANLASARSIFERMQGDGLRFLDGKLPIGELHRQIIIALIEGPLKTKRCAKGYGCDDHMNCQFRLTGNCEWWETRMRIGATDSVLA
jgi:dTMP kinase